MHKNETDSLTSAVTSYAILKELLMLILTFQNMIRLFKSFLYISLINPLYSLKEGLFLNSFLGNRMTQLHFCVSGMKSNLPPNEEEISKIKNRRIYETLSVVIAKRLDLKQYKITFGSTAISQPIP